MTQPPSISDATRKLTDNLPALRNIAGRIATTAGNNIFDAQDAMLPTDVTVKDDGSPVTSADQEASHAICSALHDLTPDIPIISEEDTHDKDTHHHTFIWMVDPIDGTQNFIDGGHDYTVNIALIHNGSPVLGVIHHPPAERLYTGCTGAHAMKINTETGAEKQIHVRPPPHKGLTALVSRSARYKQAAETFLSGYKTRIITPRSSSLKFCLIAEGKADIYPRLGPTHPWDTAAGHAILNAAGGCLLTTEGHPIPYPHHAPASLNPSFVAASFDPFET